MTKEMDNLLARYFGGDASEREMQELEQWIAQSDENQQYFDQLTVLYGKLGGMEADMPEPHIEEAKKKFVSYMETHNSISSSETIPFNNKPWYRQWMFQAASVAVLLLVSFAVWMIGFSEKEIILATNTTPKVEVLPDGTEIRLSKNSRITYSSDYGRKERKLHLVGEASFKVGHKAHGALQIFAGKVMIEDIGTVFSVSAYPGHRDIVVKVTEGQVEMSSGSNRKITLLANETCRYDTQTNDFTAFKSVSDKPSVQPAIPSGHTGSLHFNAMPLKEVVQAISDEYQVDIKLEDPGVEAREITVSFDGETLDTVLRVIAETLNLRVEKMSGGYLLRKE